VELQIAIYKESSASVAITTVRTNANGVWRYGQRLTRGRQRVEVRSRSDSGQRCAITLTGRISPL